MSASQRHSQRLFASPFFLHGPLRTGMQMLHSATRDDASWWAFCLFSSGLRQGRRAPDIFPTQGWNDWHIPGAGPRLARPESPEHVEWRCSAEGCLDMAGKLWVDTVWHRGKFQMLQLSEDEDSKKKAEEKKKKKDKWVQNRRAQSRRAAVLIWIDWLATENLLALLCCSKPVASDLQTEARQKNCEGVMFWILRLRRDLWIHDMFAQLRKSSLFIIQNRKKSSNIQFEFQLAVVVFRGIFCPTDS